MVNLNNQTLDPSFIKKVTPTLKSCNPLIMNTIRHVGTV